MSAYTRQFTIIAILIAVTSIFYYQYLRTDSISPEPIKPLSSITSILEATSSNSAAAAISASSSQPIPHLSSNMSKSSSFKFIPRLSASRGYADHGWLHSYHSFSFANYYDPKHMSYGPLRVINEDHIAKTKGFPEHQHAEFEIFTYLVKGDLTHRDSMGNVETMRRGDIQYTSAGTGIAHSEYNDSKDKDVHILQIWSKPSISRLAPTYYTRHHSSDSKKNNLKHIIKPRDAFAKSEIESIPKQDGKDELIPVPGDLNFFASILQQGKAVTHKFMVPPSGTLASGKIRLGYLHLVMTSGIRAPKEPAPAKGASIKVVAEDGTESVLTEGDALQIEAREGSEITIESVGGKDAEFVFFDMGK